MSNFRTFQDRLRWARKQYKTDTGKTLTQQKLGEMVGLTQGAIGHIERDPRRATKHFGTFAEVLGVEAYWLETGKGQIKKLSLVNGLRADYSGMDIDAIRKANLGLLIELMGGLNFFSEFIGIDKEQLVYWAYMIPNKETGKVEQITTEICRKIEEACEKEYGWLDEKHIGELKSKKDRINYDEEGYAELPEFCKKAIQNFIVDIIKEYQATKKKKGEDSPKKIFRPQVI